MKSVMTVTVFSLTTRLVGFIFKVYVSRALGAEAVGLYQIALSVLLLFVAITASGIPPILSRRVAAHIAVGEENRAASLISAGVIVCGGLALTTIATLLIVNKSLSALFSDEHCVKLFLIMLPALFSTNVYACLRSWFWGRKDYVAFSATECMEEVFRLLFTVLLASGLFAALSGATVIAVAVVVGDFLSLTVLLIVFLKKGGRFSAPAGFLPMIKSSAPLTASRLSASLVGSLTALLIPAKLIAEGLSASEATALYGRMTGMALPLIMAPTTLTGALAVVLIPEIASSFARGQNKEIADRVKNSLLFSVVIAVFFLILYVPLGEPLVRFLFKDDVAGHFVSAAAIMIFPISLNQISNTVLNSLGLEKRTLLNYVAGAALLIPSLLFLPKYVGIYSMLIGSGACFTATTILNVMAIKRKLGVGVINMRKSILAVGLGIPCLLIGWFLSEILQMYFGDFFTLAATGSLTAGFYLLSLYVFRVVDVDVLLVLRGLKVRLFSKDKSGKKYRSKRNQKHAERVA